MRSKSNVPWAVNSWAGQLTNKVLNTRESEEWPCVPESTCPECFYVASGNRAKALPPAVPPFAAGAPFLHRAPSHLSSSQTVPCTLCRLKQKQEEREKQEQQPKEATGGAKAKGMFRYGPPRDRHAVHKCALVHQLKCEYKRQWAELTCAFGCCPQNSQPQSLGGAVWTVGAYLL